MTRTKLKCSDKIRVLGQNKNIRTKFECSDKIRQVTLGYNLHVNRQKIIDSIINETRARRRPVLHVEIERECDYLINTAFALGWTRTKHMALCKNLSDVYNHKRPRGLNSPFNKYTPFINMVCSCISHEVMHMLIHDTESDDASWQWDNVAYALRKEGYI